MRSLLPQVTATYKFGNEEGAVSYPVSKRRSARECVLQALYAHELGGGDVDHVLKTVIDPKLDENPINRNFAISLLVRVIEYEEKASQLIASHAKNWDVARIAVIDRLLLRMAITEFLYFEDIPPKVSINEAIEIAKRFSTDQSSKFINGILDAVLEELQAEKQLRKTGRGLVGLAPANIDATVETSSIDESV